MTGPIQMMPGFDQTIAPSLASLVNTIGGAIAPYKQTEIALYHAIQQNPDLVQKLADAMYQNPNAIAKLYGPNVARYLSGVTPSNEAKITKAVEPIVDTEVSKGAGSAALRSRASQLISKQTPGELAKDQLNANLANLTSGAIEGMSPTDRHELAMQLATGQTAEQRAKAAQNLTGLSEENYNRLSTMDVPTLYNNIIDGKVSADDLQALDINPRLSGVRSALSVYANRQLELMRRTYDSLRDQKAEDRYYRELAGRMMMNNRSVGTTIDGWIKFLKDPEGFQKSDPKGFAPYQASWNAQAIQERQQTLNLMTPTINRYTAAIDKLVEDPEKNKSAIAAQVEGLNQVLNNRNALGGPQITAVYDAKGKEALLGVDWLKRDRPKVVYVDQNGMVYGDPDGTVPIGQTKMNGIQREVMARILANAHSPQEIQAAVKQAQLQLGNDVIGPVLDSLRIMGKLK